MPGTLAHQALQRIAKIYAVESEVRGHSAELRRSQRQLRTRPVLEEMHVWLNAALGQISAKSPMALAIGYSLSNWRALTRFLDDGRIEADNNIAERALRGVAIGRNKANSALMRSHRLLPVCLPSAAGATRSRGSSHNYSDRRNSSRAFGGRYRACLTSG